MSSEFPTMEERAAEKIIDSCDTSIEGISMTADEWYQILQSLKKLNYILYSSYEKTLTLEELQIILTKAIIRIMENTVGKHEDDDGMYCDDDLLKKYFPVDTGDDDDDEIIEDIR
jgi:hypothetical protein